MASAATCSCRVEGQADDHERSIRKISQGACEPRIWLSRDFSWSQSAFSGFHGSYLARRPQASAGPGSGPSATPGWAGSPVHSLSSACRVSMAGTRPGGWEHAQARTGPSGGSSLAALGSRDGGGSRWTSPSLSIMRRRQGQHEKGNKLRVVQWGQNPGLPCS